MKYVMGIDIGGTSIKIGAFTETGVLLEKWEIFTNKKDNGKHIISDVFASIQKSKYDFNECIGFGFGVPGPVVDGKVLSAVNLGWGSYDLALEFSKLVNNSNVIVANDANVAAVGEYFKGASKGKKDAVMITLGTGVGGGIITNGSSVDGTFGGGGEIGHIVVKHDSDRMCNCGNKGCLETIASATGIKREFHDLMKDGSYKTSFNKNDWPSAKQIIDAAKAGDPLCNQVMDTVSFYLGYACHILSITTNPEIIVIGGGVSKAGDFLLERIVKEFKKYKFVAAKDTQIALAELGNDAGMYGAAFLVING
jgi:glucokinase